MTRAMTRAMTRVMMRVTTRPTRRTIARPTRLLLALLATALAACSDGTAAKPSVTRDVDFANGAQGWSPVWVNYPAGSESFYELTADVRPLPAPLDQSRTAYFLSGANHSDDLGMVLSGRFTGLKPGASYHTRVSVTFATNAPSGCAGVGGPPGEAVGFHAYASMTETLTGTDANGYLNPLLDGTPAHWALLPGALHLGGIASSQTCGSSSQYTYELKTLPSGSIGAGQAVRADDAGDVWLWVGTRSGYEGLTSLYVTHISARFTED